MSDRPKELTAAELWNRCDASGYKFASTSELPGDVDIIGQERAVQAIEFGTGIASHGFNIYALGATGTGRTATTHAFLKDLAASQPVPNDWIYVYNFSGPNRPNAITLPPGTAAPLRQDLQEMVEDLLVEIPRAFESKEYEQQREQIMRAMQEKRAEHFTSLEQAASERGFGLIQSAMGLGIAPVVDGQPLTPEAFQQLDATKQKEIEAQQTELQATMAETLRGVRDLEKDTKRRLTGFDREIAAYAVGHHIADLLQAYGHIDEIPEYLQAAQADIVDNVDGFRQQEAKGEDLSRAMRASRRDALLRRYQINIVVDNSQQTGAPIVAEANPAYGNLVGRIEHQAEFGALSTDFSMIRAGCLHRANGGYLVLETSGLLANAAAWDALKRALKNREVRTEEIGTQLQLVSTVTLEPEPIPLDLKVVLIGDPMTYYVLHDYDEDFRKLFKVQAEFGSDFPRTAATCQSYAQFIAARCEQEGLIHFDPGAVARIVEFGSRLAGHQQKLATRFGEVADLVREASFWAKRRGGERTTAEDVQRGVDESIRRANRAEEELQEAIDDGTLRVDVTGERVGQVNGLTVMSLGNHAFGKPSRITVQTYTGRMGVVSIDREAKLSGTSFDKGLLTLDGYLGSKYAQETPMSLSASISFEQLHDEIDGDSASSTELYGMLSSLSGLPIKQGIAVTGAVDQFGAIQPIGGVNEKIEGFFITCQHRGLTGDQGVMIPVQNVVNLMLNTEVRQAVDEGTFHIYPVSTIDEGIEVLTGVIAGELQDDGNYPKDTVHGKVLDRLDEIADNLKGGDPLPPEGEEKDKGSGVSAESLGEEAASEPEDGPAGIPGDGDAGP